MRRPAGFGALLGVGDRLAALQVDDGEIGVVAGGDAALARHAEDTLRTMAGEVHEALDGKTPRVDVIEHHGNQRLHAGHARGRGRIRLRLFLQRVRRVVGAEHVDDALRDAAPYAVAMAGRAHRRVHLQQRAEPRIVVRREGQMMRRRLAGGDVLVLFEEVDLLGGRDMQHMDARPLPLRDAHQPLGAGECRDLVPPDRVRGRVAFDTLAEPFAQAELVLGMEGGAAARVPQDRGDAFVVLDQKVAGRRAHEDLDASSARQALQLSEIPRIVASAADPEREIAMHAAGGALHLVGERSLARGQRFGVGHLEDGGDAAQHRRARAGLEVFLVLHTGFAEMHLAVDHTRQDVQAGAIDGFLGGGTAEIPYGGDAAVPDADVADALAVLIDHCPACQDEIEGGWHGGPSLLQGKWQGLT